MHQNTRSGHARQSELSCQQSMSYNITVCAMCRSHSTYNCKHSNNCQQQRQHHMQQNQTRMFQFVVGTSCKCRFATAVCLFAEVSWMGPTCLGGRADPPMTMMTREGDPSGETMEAVVIPWPWGWMLTSLLPPQQGTEERQKGDEAGRAGTASSPSLLSTQTDFTCCMHHGRRKLTQLQHGPALLQPCDCFMMCYFLCARSLPNACH